jgi:hypothetical protein
MRKGFDSSQEPFRRPPDVALFITRAQETAMGTNRLTVSNALILGATLMLTSPLVFAAEATPQNATIVAAAGSAGNTANVTGSAEPVSFPSSESGVRRAAAEGPESLRRYVQRTRMIYNYYYWNFAKEQ